MKKLRITLLSTFIIISTICAFCFSQVDFAYAESEYSDYNELSITLLYPYIEKAIEEYYGYNRRFEIGDSHLEIIKRDGNIFTVKVKVDTFEGPHNNYFTEVLSFTVTPYTVTLEDYLHSEFYK